MTLFENFTFNFLPMVFSFLCRWSELDASDKEVYEGQAEEAKARCSNNIL